MEASGAHLSGEIVFYGPNYPRNTFFVFWFRAENTHFGVTFEKRQICKGSLPPVKAKNGQFLTFWGQNTCKFKLLASSRCAKRALRPKLPLIASFYSREKIRPEKVKMGAGFAKMGQNPDPKFRVSKGVNLQKNVKKVEFFRVFTKFPKVVF